MFRRCHCCRASAWRTTAGDSPGRPLSWKQPHARLIWRRALWDVVEGAARFVDVRLTRCVTISALTGEAVMLRRGVGVFAVTAVAMYPIAAVAQGQAGNDPLLDMPVIARALGVNCNYCHVPGDFTSDANPKKAVARKMIAMTRDINAAISLATGRTPGRVPRVQCVNCHRGTAIPQTLTEILTTTILQQSPEAAVEQYRDLRAKFYAKDTYDFSEDELLNFLRRVVESRPDAALPLLRMNLEFNPKSATTYVLIARVYQRQSDTATAIEMLNKALEIDPENGAAKGYLYQLSPRQR
jgi:hypothetical protein